MPVPLAPRLVLIVAAALMWGAAGHALADVVVLANRTKEAVKFSLAAAGAGPKAGQPYRIEPGDQIVVPAAGQVRLTMPDGSGQEPQMLAANSAHLFKKGDDGQWKLVPVVLDGDDRTALGTGVVGRSPLGTVAEIPIQVFCDEDERAARKAWEARFRRRIDKANEVLAAHCRVRLSIVSFGEWNSDNRLTDFAASLTEFEREVTPKDARIAIGFTSQYELPKERIHLGGTRGPFHRHILIREWTADIAESEKLEVLLHEVGHVFGAAHSADADSLMRPALGDRKSRAASFRLLFDPANTVAMNLVLEEWRVRGVKDIADITPATALRLQQIYTAIDRTLPNDPAARQAHVLATQATLKALATATRRVVQQVARGAAENAALPAGGPDTAADAPTRREGDQLAGFYVRQAAWAAKDLPAEQANLAFLLGLGVAFDGSDLLRRNLYTKALAEAVETPAERADRLRVLGQPTMRGRRDLAAHFIASAWMAALAGPETANSAGLAKELLDARGGTGFSFADLAADRAGVRFGRGVMAGRLSLLHMASEFQIEYYVPDVAGLPEGIKLEQFLADFGTPLDRRFAQVVSDIDQRLDALPPHKSGSP